MFIVLTAAALLLDVSWNKNYVCHLFYLPEDKEMLCFLPLETLDREQILLIHKCLFQLLLLNIVVCVGTNQKMSRSLYQLIILPSMEEVRDLFHADIDIQVHQLSLY